MKLSLSFTFGALGAFAFTFLSEDLARAQQTPPPTSQPVQSVTVQPSPPPAVVQPTSTTTTTSAPYVQSQDTFAEKKTEHLPNRTFLSTGVGLFVASYVPSVVVAAVSPRDEDRNLYIPAVGPWLDLGARNCGGGACGGNEGVNKGLIITAGIVQDAGILLGLSSLFVPETYSTTEKSQTSQASWRILPISYGSGAGVGAVGRF